MNRILLLAVLLVGACTAPQRGLCVRYADGERRDAERMRDYRDNSKTWFWITYDHNGIRDDITPRDSHLWTCRVGGVEDFTK